MTSSDKLAAHCPMCAQLNHCTMADISADASSVDTHACWCMKVELNDTVRQYLKNSTDGQRCLCQSCLNRLMSKS